MDLDSSYQVAVTKMTSGKEVLWIKQCSTMSANPTLIPAMPIRDFVEEKQACHIAFFFLRSS